VRYTAVHLGGSFAMLGSGGVDKGAFIFKPPKPELARCCATIINSHASYLNRNQLPTSIRILHPNHSSPSQRPSFEHAGL